MTVSQSITGIVASLLVAILIVTAGSSGSISLQEYLCSLSVGLLGSSSIGLFLYHRLHSELNITLI